VGHLAPPGQASPILIAGKVIIAAASALGCARPAGSGTPDEHVLPGSGVGELLAKPGQHDVVDAQAELRRRADGEQLYEVSSTGINYADTHHRLSVN
jgi:hypothetical protein